MSSKVGFYCRTFFVVVVDKMLIVDNQHAHVLLRKPVYATKT
jgi:hypothetical protein